MVVVVDYKAGNLYNVANALKYLQVAARFSGDPEVVAGASRVILPGVGSARAAMDSLREQGLVEVLRGLNVPFLGICLGLQLLFEESEEAGTECLGIIPGVVRRFDSSRVKVPHIGWNQVSWASAFESELLNAIDPGEFFYFVHSFYAPDSGKYSVGVTDYDVTFASAVRKKNFLGFQFHPERSGKAGLQLIRNFLAFEGGGIC